MHGTHGMSESDETGGANASLRAALKKKKKDAAKPRWNVTMPLINTHIHAHIRVHISTHKPTDTHTPPHVHISYMFIVIALASVCYFF